MITFSTCICVVLLAFIAATFSQQTSDLVCQSDREFFVPPFFKSEGFYRAFLINLSFAGITTAATSLYTVSNTSFWILRDPMLAIFLNLLVGVLASFSLEVDSDPPKNRPRKCWLTTLLILGILLYSLSVWTAVGKSESNKANGEEKNKVEKEG